MEKLEGITKEYFQDGLVKLTQDPDSTVTLHGKNDGVIITPWHQAYFDYSEAQQEILFTSVKLRYPKEPMAPKFLRNMKELFSPVVKEETPHLDGSDSTNTELQEPITATQIKTTTQIIAEKLAAAKPQENT